MNALIKKNPRLSAEERELIVAAAAAMNRAYAPYSKFKVGAAIRTWSGEIICGCNVENASLGATVCAERNAVAQAVLQGHRRFRAIAIMTRADTLVAPCGLCRQVLVEFANDLPILLATTKGGVKRIRLRTLLPMAFRGKDL